VAGCCECGDETSGSKNAGNFLTSFSKTLLHRRRAQKTEKVQTNRFNNQILANIISQICEHMIGEYLLEYYSARHVLNIVQDFRFDYTSCTYILAME
jgi:hypothetical protein